MQASYRIHRTPPLVGWSRTRCPIQNSWNSDCSVDPNLIGFRFYLFKHVEIVFVADFPHALEDADITTRNVRARLGKTPL
jgi:hypothetical protein